MISETRLFGLEVSNLGFEDIYSDEVMAEFPPNSAFQPYCPDGYMILFTREEKVNDDKSFKFKCLSLVNFSSIVHMAIMDELKGVIINPGDENFFIPVEVLLKNWRLINRTCNDSKIHGPKGNLFLMD